MLKSLVNEKLSMLLLISQFLGTNVCLGFKDVNIALGRPTWQSSNYKLYSQLLVSSLAVDGNRNTYISYCAATSANANDISPWWAVDLGRITYVRGVSYVNRGACTCANRADNFIVGLTNTSVLVAAPKLWNYTLCGRYPGAVGQGATVYLECARNAPPARYLIIQVILKNTADDLTICELEVYPRRFDWIRQSGSRMLGHTTVNTTVGHELFCMNECTNSVNCDSFNFRSTDNVCEMNKHVIRLVAKLADIVAADTSWSWWRNSFTNVT